MMIKLINNQVKTQYNRPKHWFMTRVKGVCVRRGIELEVGMSGRAKLYYLMSFLTEALKEDEEEEEEDGGGFFLPSWML